MTQARLIISAPGSTARDGRKHALSLRDFRRQGCPSSLVEASLRRKPQGGQEMDLALTEASESSHVWKPVPRLCSSVRHFIPWFTRELMITFCHSWLTEFSLKYCEVCFEVRAFIIKLQLFRLWALWPWTSCFNPSYLRFPLCG